MHYLITGAAGFVGSHLTERLTCAGHEVTALDDLSAAGDWGGLECTGAKLVEESVLHGAEVERLTRPADRVIHLAGIVGVRRAMRRGIETLRVCHLGTENVLAAATAQATRVFIASSSAIYGKIQRTPVAEEDDALLGSTTRPSWLYSVAKLSQEHLALAYHRECGTPVRIGRLFNVIGPRQSASGGMVVPRLVGRALRGQPLTVYGDGKQTRTFVDIGDALDGVELVLERGRPGTPYNIGGIREISMNDLARMIRCMTDSESDIRLTPYREALGPDFEETRQRRPCLGRLRGLGYAPHRSLETSLEAIIAHHRRISP